MINTIYSAEFDLVKGCVITGQYPQKEDIDHDLASYMIPDGVHKIKMDKFFFKTHSIKFIEGDVITYHWEDEWIPLFKSASQQLIYIQKNIIKINSINEYEWLDINLQNVQLEIIADDFVAIILHPELKYGLRCKFTQNIYMACLKNKKDSQIKRGSLIRSIAICSTDLLFFGIFDAKIEKCLDEYFDKVGVDHWEDGNNNNNNNNNIKQMNIIIQDILQNTFNNLLQESTYYCFSHQLIDYSSKELGRLYPKRYDGLTINASVIELIQKLNMKTRILYKAILQQKRIVVLCHKCNNSEKMIDDLMYYNACNIIASLCFLVQPLNIIQNIQGYKSLLDKGWEQKNNWISIVSNPIFEYRKEWWDIFFDLDTCKITEARVDQSLYLNNEQDIDFFQGLISLIQDSHINELQVRDILLKYTSTIIGNFDSTSLFSSYKKLRLKDNFNEMKYQQLLITIQMLKQQKDLEDYELFMIYKTILDCLTNDTQFTEFFQFFTEQNCNYNTLGIGSISQNPSIQLKCKQVLQLIEKFDKQLVKKINILFFF